MPHNYDVIIIGAGALGSAAAYHAARRGQRTLLLEQYELDHQRGSSYGLSRIIRYAYDHPQYIRMSKAVYPMWEALEAEAGETLHIKRVGGIDIGYAGTPDIQNRLMALTAEGIPFELLNAHEAMQRYPQFRLDEDMVALYQEDTGILRASKCVLAHVRLAQTCGAEVHDRVEVHRIRAMKDGVQVLADGGWMSAARVIITTGGWANELLRNVGVEIPLQVVRCQENYFDAQPFAEYEPGCFPAFIGYVQGEWGFPSYGIPSVDGSGLKVAWHGGPALAHANDNRLTPDKDISDKAAAWNARYLPSVGALKSSRPCLYTMTPDEHFVIDRHPEHPQIVIGACCSGHAFKYSTLIGDILVDLAMDGQAAHDIHMFRLDRFDN
jgi:monomeric sarcosine oxidase